MKDSHWWHPLVGGLILLGIWAFNFLFGSHFDSTASQDTTNWTCVAGIGVLAVGFLFFRVIFGWSRNVPQQHYSAHATIIPGKERICIHANDASMKALMDAGLPGATEYKHVGTDEWIVPIRTNLGSDEEVQTVVNLINEWSEGREFL